MRLNKEVLGWRVCAEIRGAALIIAIALVGIFGSLGFAKLVADAFYPGIPGSQGSGSRAELTHASSPLSVSGNTGLTAVYSPFNIVTSVPRPSIVHGGESLTLMVNGGSQDLVIRTLSAGVTIPPGGILWCAPVTIVNDDGSSEHAWDCL